MAQRHKTNPRRHTPAHNYSDSAKQYLLMAAWVAVTITIIMLVGNYIYAKNFKPEPEPKFDIIALTDIELPASTTPYQIDYIGHRVYFNPELHIPTAVIYELLGSETEGQVPRHKNFETDHSVIGCAAPTDYTNSGFDRGHMAPAGDMKFSKDAMHDSFKMTNICPQNKSLNTGLWNTLENTTRQWARRDSAIIVVCGPVFYPGRDTARIGNTGVAVPHAFFKAILAPAAEPMRAIAFLMPNTKCSGKLPQYMVPVDSIEAITGLDLFHNLPDEIEQEVESEACYEAWIIHK